MLLARMLLVRILLLTILLATLSCSQDSKKKTSTLSGSTMGTTYSLKLISSRLDNTQISALKANVEQLLNSLNQQMSTYIESSDIMQFNRMDIDQWRTIPSEFLDVISLSQRISQLTMGHFDITIGPLVELWGFGKFGKQTYQKIPNQSVIDEVKSRVGWQSLLLDSDRSAIKKMLPLALDVSAIAKGYAVDKIAELLDQKGIDHYLVEIGGEMRLKGLNDRDEVWRVGIEVPSLVPSLVHRQAQQIVQLSDKSIATSGDYRNFFEENGQRFSHTINPLTGWPVRHNIASVTVISDSTAKADALATALNALGEDAALALAKRENLAVYFILYDNENTDIKYKTTYTHAFKDFLVH